MQKLLIGVSVLMLAFGAVADTWTDPATGIEWAYTVKNGNGLLVNEARKSWREEPRVARGQIEAVPSLT